MFRAITTASLLCAALASVVACGGLAPIGPQLPDESLVLGETAPVESGLDDPQIDEAWRIWLAMIGAARQRLDIAQFYIANKAGSRLDAVLVAMEAAARRGVKVRVLVEDKLCATYPKTVARLAGTPGIELRRWKTRQTLGGILHAKYFIVDGREAWFGSQNFDWRSLIHIHELGARLRSKGLVGGLARLFEADWALAGGATREAALVPLAHSVTATVTFGDQAVRATLVASPKGWLPPGVGWDLPELIALIDSAKVRVRVQLLSLHLKERKGGQIDGLVAAMRRAGERGVQVQMLLSHWMRRRSRIVDALKLQAIAGVTVRLLEVPASSEGFVPFSRVIHAKYAVVDGQRAWLGTSNWSWGYFHKSRNVGLLVDGAPFAGALDRVFERAWSHPGAATVDPAVTYEAPRISR